MKLFLIFIMLISAIMTIFYFLALFTKQHRFLIYFRIAMLALILILIISWIISILLKLNFTLLLIFAVVFIILYALS